MILFFFTPIAQSAVGIKSIYFQYRKRYNIPTKLSEV